jgi:nucleoside-diphosphate-sugar epimerase
MSFKLLMVGFGKLPTQVLDSLVSAGYLKGGLKGSFTSDLKCDVLKQTPLLEKPLALNKVYLGSVAEPASWAQLPQHYDAILFCLSPAGRSPSEYEKVFEKGLSLCAMNFKQAEKMPHVIFVSSTSVYGQHKGEIVSEDSPTEPTSATAVCLVAAEQVLIHSGLAHTIVRFSGIYGGSRTRMLDQVVDQAPLLSQAARLSNRIHESDCVGFLSFLIAQVIEKKALATCYVASDSEPCELNEVYEYIADRLGVGLSFGELNTGSSRGGNKRCSNARMLASGYTLKYPSFRDGYSELIGKRG